MGPPASAKDKEPRRSVRRSQPSTSTSKSSESPSPDISTTISMQPQQKSNEAAGGVRFSSATSVRSKRTKEEGEDQQDEQANRSASVSGGVKSNASAANSRRGQRKMKEKNHKTDTLADDDYMLKSSGGLVDTVEKAEDDEDAGITRCVCEGRGKTPEYIKAER